MNWQPIETAPKDGTHVLVRYNYGSRKSYVAEAWFFAGIWHRHGDSFVRAVEWMPLPQELDKPIDCSDTARLDWLLQNTFAIEPDPSVASFARQVFMDRNDIDKAIKKAAT